MEFQGTRKDDEKDGLEASVIGDMRTRIQHLEASLPPRVEALETAVTDISKDLRSMRHEMGQSRQDTRQQIDRVYDAIKKETNAINETNKQNQEKADKMQTQLERMTRRLTFGSGALWVVGAGLAFMAYYWDALTRIIILLENTQ